MVVPGSVLLGVAGYDKFRHTRWHFLNNYVEGQQMSRLDNIYAHELGASTYSRAFHAFRASPLFIVVTQEGALPSDL